MKFNVHTPETAPEEARTEIEETKAAFGMVPNLMGIMAEAPALLSGYRALSGYFANTSFDKTEKNIILLMISQVNECHYCLAAHGVAADGQGVDKTVTDALIKGAPLDNPKWEALRSFTESLVQSRGWPSDKASAAFQEAGYTQRHALEVVLGVGLKIMSNYTNHLADTPLDPAFAGRGKG